MDSRIAVARSAGRTNAARRLPRLPGALRLVAFAALWVASLAGGARADEAMDARIQALAPDLAAYVEKGMTSFDDPGLAIGIVSGDKLVYAKGFGVQKRRRASRHPHRLPDQFGDQGLSCHNARDRRRSRQVPLGAVALVS